MQSTEKEEFVLSLFSDKIFFQRKVLNVKSSKDKLEITDILVKKIIRDVLKNELNFLYIEDMKKFQISLISNILFKEFANEWLSFAQDILAYTREEAIEEIKEKSRVLFISSIVEDHLVEYKKYYFQEIADTFLELIELSVGIQAKNELIETVLESSLVNVNFTLTQLRGHIKSAHNYKVAKLSALQVKIAESLNTLEYAELELSQREKTQKYLSLYKKEEDSLQKTSLDSFDAALKRLTESMILAMSFKY